MAQQRNPAIPPGWPRAVRPAGAPDWEQSAVSWLLDQCPPEYRGYPVIVRHPVALAWLAGRHADAALAATRAAIASVRGEVGDALPPPALHQFLEALQTEQVRLIDTRRAVTLVQDALRGVAYVPRL
jgi:hypothetical protein